MHRALGGQERCLRELCGHWGASCPPALTSSFLDWGDGQVTIYETFSQERPGFLGHSPQDSKPDWTQWREWIPSNQSTRTLTAGSTPNVLLHCSNVTRKLQDCFWFPLSPFLLRFLSSACQERTQVRPHSGEREETLTESVHTGFALWVSHGLQRKTLFFD